MTKIAFTGDLGFTKYFKGAETREDLIEPEVVEFLSDSDYTVVNVEGAVSSGKITAEKELTHANRAECVDWLKKLNGNIWNIANNHIMDCGIEGLKSTLDVAAENNCQTVGIGLDLDGATKPVIINDCGGIGIISVTYDEAPQATETSPGCIQWNNEALVEKVIKDLKKTCRWCIVVAHVGLEFAQIPLPFIRARLHRYLDWGADVIVGHHPHVVENYETVGNKIIFYSLGNFIFDTDYQRLQKYTHYGMLVKINFTEESFSWEYLPININRETHTIEKGECPAIFTNIDEKLYKKLWPLAALYTTLNERKKYIYKNPELANNNSLKWLRFELNRRFMTRGKELIKGRILYYFGIWRFAPKELVNYIKNKGE